MPIWFDYDPFNNVYTLQLIQGEIIGIEDFDEFSAKAEIFIHQTSKCENIESLFPEKEIPESLYDIDTLFPVGSLKIGTYGSFILISSMIQDGGNRALIADDEIYPRLIHYSEGWFNHWQSYVGNIRIKKSFLHKIQKQVNDDI